MDRVWIGVKVVAASAAGWWLGLPGAFKALLLLQLLDIASGVFAATQEEDRAKRLSSSVMMRGVRRKGQAWIVVLVVAVLEWYLAAEFAGGSVSLLGVTPAAGVAGYYAITEALSIVENAERAGLPIPAVVSNALAQQRKRVEG